MNRWPILLTLFVLVGACSDGDGPTGPFPAPPAAAPAVGQSIGFGDPPVTGVVTIGPGGSGEAWSFAVDVGGDGSPDATGEVGAGTEVPFEFTEPGIHRIGVELARGGERFRTERLVIVNDLEATEVVRTAGVTGGEDLEPVLRELEGITLGEGPTGLELYVAMAQGKRVLRLDPATLEVRDSVTLSSEDLGVFLNTLEGMDLDPTGEFLYVVSKGFSLIVLSTSDLEPVRAFGVSGAAFTVHALSPGIVVTGGEGPVSVIDATDGTILNQRQILGARNFAVSSDGTRLALIQRVDRDTPRSIRFLRVPELSDLGTTVLPADFAPEVLAFEPSGEKLYVLGSSPGLVRFFAIDVATAEIVVEQPLDGPGFAFGSTIANPHATSLDGRFVVFPSINGGYVVDTGLDLPLFRVPRLAGCCNVAASPRNNEFFFANQSPEVSVVRLNR